MAVEVVVFDVGETLVDETGMWMRAAELAGVPPFTLMGVLGGLAARGEPHNSVWGILGVEQAGSTWSREDWYSDALPCIGRLRAAGYRVGASGNTPAFVEDDLRAHVDFAGSSASWGVQKPASEFFARLAELAGVEPGKIAYVGDRVDNDVRPALAAGMVAVHIRRGPWGYLHEPPDAAIRICSLDELPSLLP
jgi:phosphoglycolate phosphatase-like HAD superfamily hydrolase